MAGVPERCTSCDAEVFWLRHERTGKFAPIDSELREDGNVLCDFQAGTYRIVSRDVEASLPGLEPVPALRVNHFASCPNAANFRSQRRRQPQPA